MVKYRRIENLKKRYPKRIGSQYKFADDHKNLLIKVNSLIVENNGKKGLIKEVSNIKEHFDLTQRENEFLSKVERAQNFDKEVINLYLNKNIQKPNNFENEL